MVAMGLVKSSHKVWQRLGQGDTRLGGEEVDSSGAVSVLLDETAVVLRAWRRVDGCPAVLAVVAQAVDVATEVGGVASTTMQSMTFITHLVIKNIWFHLDLLVNVPVSDLEESAGDGAHETDPGTESHPASPFWVLELRVTVNASITDIAISRVEDVC